MENKHKFEKNPKYYTISLYVIATVIISAILLKIIWHWASTIKSLEHIIGMLMPFLIGLLIAYLMNPLVKGLDKKLFEKIFRIKKANVRKALSIFISYIFVLGIIIVCISVIIPEIYSSRDAEAVFKSTPTLFTLSSTTPLRASSSRLG